jgi:hypothetical protein
MFVGDFLNCQSACRSLSTKSAYRHAAVRETKLDCVFESERFVWMNVVIGGLQSHFL